MERNFVDALALGYIGGRPVVVSCLAHEAVEIWDARTGELLQTLGGYEDWIGAVAL